jgi:DNA-binding transcriptional MerR regulator
MSVRLPIATEAFAPPPAGDVAGEVLRVGDLATRTSKTVRALHLYEELGLLLPIERSKGGYRLYAASAVLRVKWISRLQDLGFSLPDIRAILQAWEGSPRASDANARIREIYAQKLRDTDEQLRRLRDLRHELDRSVEYLSTCNVCDPERLISACPQCDRHCGDAVPEMVAGLHNARHPHPPPT